MQNDYIRNRTKKNFYQLLHKTRFWPVVVTQKTLSIYSLLFNKSRTLQKFEIQIALICVYLRKISAAND